MNHSSSAEFAAWVIGMVLISCSTIFYFYGDKQSRLGNSKQVLPRTFLTDRAWQRIHILSQFLFLAIVIGGTISEVIAYTLGRYSVLFLIIPRLDHFIALPSLGISMVSGVASVRIRYWKRNRPAPPHVHASVWTIQAFGIYWAVADKVTQAVDLEGGADPSKLHEVFWIRALINFGSCAIALYLWALMSRKVEPPSLFSKERGGAWR